MAVVRIISVGCVLSGTPKVSGLGRSYLSPGPMMARSWWPASAFPWVIRKSAVDHQTAMARPPTTRKTTPRLRNGTRRHQRRIMTGASATVAAPAKIDNKRTCGGLFRKVNCMASVFRRTVPEASTITAISLDQMGHFVGPRGPGPDRPQVKLIEPGLDLIRDR